MASVTNLVQYASISRRSEWRCTVIAEHKIAKEGLAEFAFECLEKVPPFHNQVTYTIYQRKFLFLMDDGGFFTYCAIVDEALGKLKGFGFLKQVRDEFKLLLRSRGLDGLRLERNALLNDFAGVFGRLVKPLVGIPQKAVDLNDLLYSESTDFSAWTPSASFEEHSHPGTNTGGPSLLSPNGRFKGDRKSSKYQVVQVKEIMMTNSGKKLYKQDSLKGKSPANSDRTPKRPKNIFAKAKEWLEGKSPADTDRPGMPRPASSSYGDRNGSPEGDDYQIQGRSRESIQDDDRGPSAKSLDMAILEVKSAVNHFAKALISDMNKHPEELRNLNQTIRHEVKPEVDRANHWKFLVQAFVCERLFEGFDTENGFFGIDYFEGLNSTPFISFADFCKFMDKAATISELLAKDSADVSFLGKFCFQKFKSITRDLNTNRPLPIYQKEWSMVARGRHPRSAFYKGFLKAAVSVWLLHRLVHSSEQGWKMLGWETYPKGSKFQRKNMKSVVYRGYEEEDDVITVVGFLVLPGFQVSKSVVKCEVYPNFMHSHQPGKVDEILIPAVLNEKNHRDRPQPSSRGNGNAVESSSQESSQLLPTDEFFSTAVSSEFPERSPACEPSENAYQAHEPELTRGFSSSFGGNYNESSKRTPLRKVRSNNGLEGRSHENSQPFQAYKSSVTLDDSPHEVSEPLPTHISSSSSASRQDGRNEPSPMYKPSDSIFEDVVKKYTWDQVLQMTNGPTSRQVGKGGFGTVYLGRLENGREVAVKILDRSSQQGIPEFQNEVNLLRRVNHVNLVRLLGYCQDEEQVLIYEFAEEGSIWDHLHGERKWLDWKQRLSIAIQSAYGLEYLHTLCTPRIIHRDIKSENILLTKTMVAKVADFGSSRLGADHDNNWKTHFTTKVIGTRGYLDPEYHLTGQLRDSSDVYSFGIVLLEIITGRKPVPNSDPKCCITNWVEKSYGSGGSRAVKALADPLFSDNYDPRALKLVINVARSCVRPSGESRPDISEVVRVLRKAQTLEQDEKKSWIPFL